MAEKEKLEKEGVQQIDLNERLESALSRNRKPILVCCVIILLAVAGTIAGFAIHDHLKQVSFAALEELNRRYETLRFDIANADKAEDVKTLLADVTSFAGKHSGYIAGKAWAIAGNIYADRKEWAESLDAWNKAAKAAAKTYLAGAAGFNAAVAAEEQGNVDEAIKLYAECAALSDSFPMAPRAQFSIGRLQEQRGDKTKALESYRQIVTKWPNDAVWTSLAQDRIIVLDK